MRRGVAAWVVGEPPKSGDMSWAKFGLGCVLAPAVARLSLVCAGHMDTPKAKLGLLVCTSACFLFAQFRRFCARRGMPFLCLIWACERARSFVFH